MVVTGALIPIRDINPRHRVPWVNYGLLGLNAAVFLYEVSLGADVEGLVERHAFAPAQLEAALASPDPGAALLVVAQAVLTGMFLHVGWFHVLGNLLYLRVFGDNLEDRLGHVGYLAFYLAAGVAGAAGHYLADPSNPVPALGATGAIAGVLGAYMVMFPAARVVTLFPVLIFLTFIEVPAVVFLGIWAAQQLLNQFATLADPLPDAVPWFAHLGGVVFGAAVGAVYQLTAGRRRRQQRDSARSTSEHTA
ncbi:MAG: rhomboid family intramembrane serine protease [Myxococcales bacterium]|nr:rhomboid family intramembrane serine protease [Myxococcales bacterium]